MSDKTDLLAVVDEERARHPRWDGRDLRKLIYQSVFGGDHLLDDPERFERALREEWVGLSAEHLPMIGTALQTIDPDGHVARIHLAVCKRMGVDVDRLIELLIGQKRKDGRPSDFDRRWDETIALAREGRIPFSADELVRIGAVHNAHHHGPDYGFASYRIVHDVKDPAMRDGLRRLGVRS